MIREYLVLVIEKENVEDFFSNCVYMRAEGRVGERERGEESVYVGSVCASETIKTPAYKKTKVKVR